MLSISDSQCQFEENTLGQDLPRLASTPSGAGRRADPNAMVRSHGSPARHSRLRLNLLAVAACTRK